MGAIDLVKAATVLLPILALVATGTAITLRSGVVSLGSAEGLRRAAGNLSGTIVAVAACVVGLLAIQQLVGFHAGLLR